MNAEPLSLLGRTLRKFAESLRLMSDKISFPARALTKAKVLLAELLDRIWSNGMPLLGLKPGIILSLAATLTILLIAVLASLKPSAPTEKKPTEELLTVLVPVSSPTPISVPTQTPTRPPVQTPTVTPLVKSGVKLVFVPVISDSATLSVQMEDKNSGKASSFKYEGFGSTPTLPLPAGVYKPTVIVETSGGRGRRFSAQIICPDEVQVAAGKITEISCRIQTGPPPVCFSPVAGIIRQQKLIRSGEKAEFSGAVQGGQNYGELSYEWSDTAGKTTGKEEKYILDTTGMLPGTVVTLNLRVTSGSGNCSASAQTRLTIEGTTPKPILMPELKGQDLASAQRTLEALGLSLQITTQYVNDQQSKPDIVLRQVPESGQALQLGQKVTLDITKSLPLGPCVPFLLTIMIYNPTPSQQSVLTGEKSCVATPVYSIKYVLREKSANGEYYEILSSKVSIDQDQEAQFQALVNSGLTTKQTQFLNGPITESAQELSASAQKLSESARKNYINTNGQKLGLMLQLLVGMSKPQTAR
jgi:PASTA domain